MQQFASFEVFMAVKIQVDVFGVVTPCSSAAGYQRFGGPRCLHLQDRTYHPNKKL